MSDQAQYSEAQEKARALASDYRAVFGSPEGQRVLRHLMDIVLYGKAVLKDPTIPNTTVSAENALYIVARRDAGIQIQGIMEYDPRDHAKPAVKTMKDFQRPHNRRDRL